MHLFKNILITIVVFLLTLGLLSLIWFLFYTESKAYGFESLSIEIPADELKINYLNDTYILDSNGYQYLVNSDSSDVIKSLIDFGYYFKSGEEDGKLVYFNTPKCDTLVLVVDDNNINGGYCKL